LRNLSLKSSENLSNLHILRGLTALYVVIYHAKFILWCGGREYIKTFPREDWNVLEYLSFASDIFTSAGFEMVLVFFILSGFFIAQSFEKHQWRLTEFYFNRTIRIYPPYVASLLFAALIMLLVSKINPSLFLLDLPYERNQLLRAAHDSLDGEAITLSLIFNFRKGFVGMNLVYWSLIVEVFFYLIAPFAVRNWIIYLFLSIVGLLFFQATSLNFINSLSTYSIYFVIGILMFRFRNHNMIEKVSEYKWLFLALALILFIATVGLSVAGYKSFSACTVSVFSIIVIFVLLKISLPANRLIDWLMELGKFSYSLYLFHVPVLLLIYSLFSRFTNIYNFYSRIYWIAIPFTIFISYIFYQLVEKRSLQLTEIFKRKKPLASLEN